MRNVMSETSRTDDDDEIAYRSRDLETMTTLSPNEAEVLARKEVGQTHREIGASMGIEKGTVDSHAHRGRVKYNMAVTTVQELQDFYEPDTYSATVSIDSVIKALRLNATYGDERTIAVPRKTGGSASIRRDFRGSERYENPDSAPVHINPESLVEDEWERPPTRAQVDLHALDVPQESYERDEADESRIDEALEVLRETWETDVRGMVRGESTVELRDHNGTVTTHVTVVGVED